jgi:UDP-glucose 4-epimerase
MAEQLVASYSSHFHLSASVVRLFSVYGCGLRKQLLWDACRKVSSGDQVFMGTGAEIRDWLHVDDAAALMLLAMRNADPTCPTVNGGTGAGVTTREIVLHIARNISPGGVAPEFSGTTRPGDPNCYIADVTRARQWGWKAKKHWRDGVAEYAAWWLTEKQCNSDPAVLAAANSAA